MTGILHTGGVHARVDEHPLGGAGEPHQVTGVYQYTAAQLDVIAISCKEIEPEVMLFNIS